ncbi:EamA family transporter [Oscillatoria sp. CS-180]|uniref:EamA family transporter n=1 Tax=Oscillatoria sp. CS-180 TaxID=3021720 RepID=UPI00232EF890|nr:EamA family transporter [Oscillatoria sp. CS-180]MDB9528819.1 EamA family transporter [Oscillatoria sp. CS-180]
MDLRELTLLLIAVLTNASGQLLLKLGALKIVLIDSASPLIRILRIIVIPELLAGLGLYAFGAVIYIFLLTRVKLSIAAPAGSLVYVFTVLLSYFVLGESLSILKYLGLVFIVLGVALLASP